MNAGISVVAISNEMYHTTSRSRSSAHRFVTLQPFLGSKRGGMQDELKHEEWTNQKRNESRREPLAHGRGPP
jgi:hypothetical protein